MRDDMVRQRGVRGVVPSVVAERLAATRGFVFDMDGTLVLGDRQNHRLRPLPGALEITSWAARRGLPFVVFTNGTTRTPAHYARTMRDIGFGLPDEAMLTPASSAVRVFVRAGYQRVMVLGGSRYEMVPDQVIRYVLGSFGKPTAPVEPWVLDRILERPRARELAAEPPPLSVAELRRRLPHGISDEELLLRFGMPAEEVDAMLAAAPAPRHYTPELQPVLRLLRELGARPPVRRLVVDKPGFRLSLSGPGDPGRPGDA